MHAALACVNYIDKHVPILGIALACIDMNNTDGEVHTCDLYRLLTKSVFLPFSLSIVSISLRVLPSSAQEEGADALREAGAVTVIVRLLGAIQDCSVKELIIETISSAAQNGRLFSFAFRLLVFCVYSRISRELKPPVYYRSLLAIGVGGGAFLIS